jgi:gamma-glutamyltranspeptidase/glutathione hydrolase
MQMNNMMGESFLLPDGFHSWQENVRLNSMMTPTMVLDGDGKFCYSGGSGGAGRIPFMISQVIKALFDQDMNLEDATKKSRVHVQEDLIHFEKGALLTPHSFEKTKEWDYKSLFFGGVHSVFQGKNGNLQASGDARRYGVAEVF